MIHASASRRIQAAQALLSSVTSSKRLTYPDPVCGVVKAGDRTSAESSSTAGESRTRG